ncbi:MAG: SDR family NAD(P)-dependent oxidoreductase, partial [Betaproteobacteria bacterium AqS2]|nr:SDR family NAD(P)-dependent oxidoreductase [Betaproteobacteria bacterium AqS2]
GAATAELLAAAGAKLLLSARDADALEALRERLGPGHETLPWDVTVPVAQQKPPDPGSLDGLLYCAGDYEPMDAASFDPVRAERIVAVNLTGLFGVTAHLLPAWRERRRGHFAVVGSIAGHRALPRSLAYGASKAGLEYFTESLALEVAAQGICVQLARPGFVRTRLTAKNDFAMPFIIEPGAAAARLVAGMAGSSFRIDFPRRLTWPLRLAALLPHWLYRRLLRG